MCLIQQWIETNDDPVWNLPMRDNKIESNILCRRVNLLQIS